jgi:RNA polymerase sigma-70 factor (ECF subfamily)
MGASFFTDKSPPFMDPSIERRKGMQPIDPHQNFEAWFLQQRPALMRMAASILKDASEAEDVVQDTALILWQKLAQGGIDNPTAYLRRAVWINALKRRSRRRDWTPLDAESLAKSGHAEPQALALPDLQLTAWELETALLDLPPAQQAVLRLRFYGGLSFEETSKALSISINTAASRCRYALATLRQALKPDSEPEPETEPGPFKEPHHGKPRSRTKRPLRRR